MAGVDTSVMDGLEKDIFEKGVSEGVNNNFPLKDFFEDETDLEDEDWQGGGGIVWSHHVGRNVSPMASREGAAMANAGNQRHIKGRIGIRKLTARLEMTAESMKFYTRSEASFANGMADEKTRLVDDISNRKEHYLSTDGRGVYARIDDSNPDGDNTLELDAPGGITGDAFGNRFLYTGMHIGAVNPATGALRAGMTQITAVNEDGTDVTADMTGLTAWADNDYIVQVANSSVTDVLDSSFEAALWGLPALIDDGTYRDDYFGISRTDAPSLKSYVVGSAGAFSLDLAQRTSDVVAQKLGGEVDTLVMHHSVRREYIKLLNADRRYNGASLLNPDGGTAAMKQKDLTLGECTIKAIRSIGLDQVYFLDTQRSGFKRYVAEPGKFDDTDGTIWQTVGSGESRRHKYEALWYSWEQNHCKNPGFNARWDGVTGQTLVVVRAE